MKKVLIASKNPAKINAVQIGFTKAFPDAEFEFIGHNAKSEVSDQPVTDSETKTGAINRVKNLKKEYPNADFWVGLEGGILEDELGMHTFGYVYIESESQRGISRAGSFLLPPEISEIIHMGKELGDAIDIVFEKYNSKHDQGAVGTLTNGVVPRSDGFAMGVVLALVPFINKELFKN